MPENYLKHLDEFRKLLKDYRPKSEFVDLLNDLELVLLVSPAATGKNTIINQLLLTGAYHHVVSDTTRHPRINNGIPEVNGKEYWFRSEDEVIDDLRRGNYITPDIIHEQQVSAINFSEIEKTKSQDKIAIAEVNIEGANRINEYCHSALIIFLLPPNYEEWLRRMENRGHLSDEEKTRRLHSATDEIKHALETDFFTFLVNKDIQATSEKINELVAKHARNEEHESAKIHARELLAQLEKELG